MSAKSTILGGMFAVLAANASIAETSGPFDTGLQAAVRPVARDPYLPAARWDATEDGALWTRVALAAFEVHAPDITDIMPRDIEAWCPGYAQATEAQRRAFWVGMMSALSWHESRHLPHVVGGSNQWFGLMQIYPPTARGYECRARSGSDLRDPTENLSCATRIMAVTVERDEAVALHDGRWRGVAADWGPMVSRTKRNEMIAWTRTQNYCVAAALRTVPLPPARPEDLAALDATVGSMSLAD